MLRILTLCVLSLLLKPGKPQDRDILTAMTPSSCTVDPPTGLSISNIGATSATVTWDLLSSQAGASFYQIVYHPVTHTAFQTVNIPVLSNVDTAVLTDLESFVSYRVYVRVACMLDSFGQLSQPESFVTLASKPDEMVTNLNVTVMPAGGNLVHISWDHLNDSAWNGGFGRYIVFTYHLSVINNVSLDYVSYPGNSHYEYLPAGVYTFAVTAINAQGIQSDNSSFVQNVLVGGGLAGGLDYPHIYIIVPGIIFLAVIIVVTVVIFKKVHESRKRGVSYCKDIDPGYSNAIPLQQHRSPSSSMSPAIQSPGANQNTIANRPLPLSPNGPSPTRQVHRHSEPEVRQVRQQYLEQEPPSVWVGRQQPLEQEPPRQRQQFFHQEPPSNRQPQRHFEQELPSNRQPQRHFEQEPPSNRQPRQQELPQFGGAAIAPAPKIPHPGPLPLVTEDPDFVAMHRSMTNQSSASVFSPTGAVAPMTGQPRARAQTVGVGEAFPYEVPENNGSTLSRGDSSAMRPSSAGVVQHRGVNRGGNFPPPPAHSPPPLTHSSMELRARMDSGEIITNPPSQNTLPRSNHQGAGSKISPGGLKHIRSEGHFPIFEADEKLDDSKAFIRPLDSSQETSIHSQSSFGQNGVARRPSLETSQYPYRGGLASNSSVVDSEFSNISERGEHHHPLPRAPQHNPGHHLSPGHRGERNVRSAGRESLFSETSIELSVSSTSEREISPEWDHRGVTSDVGIGILHESPESRETVSEVGTGFSQRTHLVYKQV